MILPRALLSILVGAFTFLGSLSPVGAEIRYVNISAPPGGNGLSWQEAYDSLPAAIAASEPGDQIWVAAGMYVGNFTLALEVELYGGFAGTETDLSQRDWKDNPTILDGDQGGSVVTSPPGAIETTRIDGFTITGGTGSQCPYWPSSSCGGGLYLLSSSPTIANNTITANSARYGGGLSLWNSAPTIANNTITRNSAGLYGGGLSLWGSSPTIVNNTITDNDAHRGGGGGLFLLDSSPTIANNTITGNSTISRDGGGGLLLVGSSPRIINNTITGNSGGWYGGGLSLWGSSPTIANNTITDNDAHRGGGLSLWDSSPMIASNTIMSNSADSGGGLYRFGSSRTLVINCILWGNGPDEILNDFRGDHDPAVIFSDVQGGVPVGTIDGGGNIDADPLFVRNPSDGGDGWGDDPDTTEIDEGANDDFGDLRLQSGSPCINAGAPGFIPTPGQTDLDGHARVLCGRVDMGAYEFGIGDYDCNGVVDLDDFAAWDVCMTGPDIEPYWEGCEAFDFDADEDIDFRDYAGFQRRLPAANSCEGGNDRDKDTFIDACDNCPDDSNWDQADGDDDGTGDVCDNCPTISNADQANSDGDHLGDGCDNCPLDTNANQLDYDGDDIGNTCDNCPDDVNSDQANGDGDGVGDACDLCAETVTGVPVDGDGCPLQIRWVSTTTDGGVTQLLVNRIGYGLPEEYEVGNEGNLVTASFTLDADAIAIARSGDVTIQSTQVSLGVETNMYRVDNIFPPLSFTFEAKLTITTFQLQIFDRTAIWTFDYTVEETDTVFGTDQTTQFLGTVTGDVSDDGSIVWSSVVGVREICDLIDHRCPSLVDLAAEGVFPLGKWRREVIE